MLFPGDKAFEMKATHGVPLDIVFDQIINVNGLILDWSAFIGAARRNGWWDYQTIEAVETGLTDAGIAPNTIKEIVTRMRLYMMTFRHPAMND